MSRRVLTCGELALLIEVDSLDEVLLLDAAVRAAIEAAEPGFAGVLDVVPGAETLLITVGNGVDLAPLRRAVHDVLADFMSSTTVGGGDGRQQASPVVDIVVNYDGPDLDEVAKMTGLTTHDVVCAHTMSPWRVAFSGFSPGFAYLTSGDPRLEVPRRSHPRTSVPAGSVGLAGAYCGIYPRSSPGGWQLLGHTDAVLWDVDREPAALLQPGSTVRFVDAGEAARR
jgi:KipI family sensor histidine kinase inhibitor